MERSMTRRDLLVRGGGAMMVAGLPPAAALAAGEHAGHGTGPHQALVSSARDCVAEGEACLAHCLALFATGDTSLAACAKSVSEMMAACSAVADLATLGSKRLGQFLGPCIDVCTDCEQECRKHADKHAVCKACADDCARFIAEAKKVRST
jgi:Cys-rich four helix bundle protein (predicted Tat secretion target)